MARAFFPSWLRKTAFLFLLCVFSAAAAGRPLVVVSIDGLDHRYLRDRDKLGLRIPNLRRLIEAGAWADGVLGVVPSVTWPSHTTLVTGVPPHAHGILGNSRPKSEGGEYYWSATLLKAKTLWQAARAAGLKTAAVHWPVTVDAAIDWNIPEFFRERQGGAMDRKSAEGVSTPGLMKKISKQFPSFLQQWIDDRVRTLAALYLLRWEHPDLLLLHLVDLDGEQHANGPFTPEAYAVLEYTDELLGTILAATPKNAVVAIVSDHGFERVDKLINLAEAQKRAGRSGRIEVIGGYAIAWDREAAEFLRESARNPDFGIAREIPADEFARLAPQHGQVAAAFEPVVHAQFARNSQAPLVAQTRFRGEHGFWPTREDYRATFLLWGAGVRKEHLPEIDMLSVAGRLAAVLNVPYPFR